MRRQRLPDQEGAADGAEQHHQLPVWLVKVSRFASVGALSGAVYALVTAGAISLADIAHSRASVLGYLAALPLNFFMQRSFTFNSQGHVAADLAKYTVTQVVNMALCWAAMAIAVDAFAFHYVFGILASIIVVPLMTYFVMDNWVFATQSK